MKAEGPGYNGAASSEVRWQQMPAIVVSIRLLKEFALVTKLQTSIFSLAPIASVRESLRYTCS